MKSGNLNFLEPSGPLQACNGTDLPLLFRTSKISDSLQSFVLLRVFFLTLTGCTAIDERLNPVCITWISNTRFGHHVTSATSVNIAAWMDGQYIFFLIWSYFYYAIFFNASSHTMATITSYQNWTVYTVWLKILPITNALGRNIC